MATVSGQHQKISSDKSNCQRASQSFNLQSHLWL